MSLFYEWVDIVTYPQDPEKIISKEQRLNVESAVWKDSKDYSPENVNKKGIVITKDSVIFEEDDEFEVTQISNYGNVLIWTKKRVWFLQNQGNKEKLIFLPRNPEYSHFDVE